MEHDLLESHESSETPYLIFQLETGELIQGNKMARAFYSVDSRKLRVRDILIGITKDIISTQDSLFIANILTQKANGRKYECICTFDVIENRQYVLLKIELVKDCLVKPLVDDMQTSQNSEFILHFNEKLNIYYGNDKFYEMLGKDVELIHKDYKNSFLGLIPKNTRKYLMEQLEKNLFKDVNILQVKIDLLGGNKTTITFQKISDKIYGQVTDYQFTQEDITVIGQYYTFLTFELTDIRDFNSGLNEMEKEILILETMASRLKEVSNPAKVFGKLDTYRYSLLLELSHYNANTRAKQVQAIVDSILGNLTQQYNSETGYLTVKISIGYTLFPNDCNDFDSLTSKTQIALDTSKCFENSTAIRYSATLEKN